MKKNKHLDYYNISFEYASIASEAAIDLDNMIIGRYSGNNSVKDLTEYLTGAVDFMREKHLFFNSLLFANLACDYLGYHGKNKLENSGMKTANDVADGLSKVVIGLKNFKTASVREIHHLRGFCCKASEQFSIAWSENNESGRRHLSA